jgi:hypothetical protein
MIDGGLGSEAPDRLILIREPADRLASTALRSPRQRHSSENDTVGLKPPSSGAPVSLPINA